MDQEGSMKAQALVPALALAAALLAPPLADAAQGHRRGGHPPAHGYYGHRPAPAHHGYRGHGYGHYGYRPARPYYRSHRHYAPPPAYYGYGYGGYGAYGYGYYLPPPPPRYVRPRVGVGIWFGF
jgi:hypothetical protein